MSTNHHKIPSPQRGEGERVIASDGYPPERVGEQSAEMFHKQSGKAIAFIPLDDRPCCLQYPVILASIAGLDLLTPPRASLGSFLKPGEPGFLLSWLTDNVAKSTELLFSVDMLAYGGLVASRIFSATAEESMERLKFIFELSKARNRISVYAFNSIMRVAPTASNSEEVKLAKKIVEYSVLKESLRNSEDTKKRNKFDSLKQQIPTDYLNLYFESRERNHLINKRMIYWAKDGYIDFLLLGIDDSKTCGFNITEKGILESLIELQGIADRVKIYPGTDEMAMIGLARLLLSNLSLSRGDEKKQSPLPAGERDGVRGHERSNLIPKIFPIYSNEESKFLIPSYEDRSIKDIISAQVDAAGAVLAESKEDADILLFVHTPIKVQKEAARQNFEISLTDIKSHFERLSPCHCEEQNKTPSPHWGEGKGEENEGSTGILPVEGEGETETLSPLPAGERDRVRGHTERERGKAISLFINKINEALASGKFVSLADVAYANGAGNKFIKILLENVDVTKLSSFAAWNTAGNSIGTAISHGIIRWACLKSSTGFQPVDTHSSPLLYSGSDLELERSDPGQVPSPLRGAGKGEGAWSLQEPPYDVIASEGSTGIPAREFVIASDGYPPERVGEQSLSEAIESEKAHLKFLLMRFIDDWLYQSKIRQELAFEIKSRGGEPSNLKEHLSIAESILSKKILPEADEFFKKYFSGRKTIVKDGKENLELTIGGELDLEVCLPWHRLFEIELEVDFSLE